ncbi:MAG: NAD(+)/NADH kinase [Candidatus Hadarchaeales archaeon]
MRIMIIGHGDRETVKVAKKLVALLKGHEIVIGGELAEKLAQGSRAAGKLDAVIAAGGDGTVLRAVAVARGAPILGIHLGGRGFLAQVEPKEMEKAVREMISGKLELKEVMMLKSILKGRRLPDALNEVCVISAKTGKTVALRVSVGERDLGEVVGDGFIVATPTGSTGYSLAANGPIVAPEIDGMVLTSICPCGRSFQPMVIPAEEEVLIEPTRDNRDAIVLVDGKIAGKLVRGEKIAVTRSERKARFYAWRDFYSSLREKL